MACSDDGANEFAGEVPLVCPMTPAKDGTVQGALTQVTVSQTCTTDNTAMATPAAAAWTESKKFCRATDVGAGCDSGKACVPKQPEVSQCALAEAGVACDGYAVVQPDWFTSYTDSRQCGACSCAASGGHCDGVTVALGSDWGCTETVTIKNGAKWCGSVYSPPAWLSGAPVIPPRAPLTRRRRGASTRRGN